MLRHTIRSYLLMFHPRTLKNVKKRTYRSFLFWMLCYLFLMQLEAYEIGNLLLLMVPVFMMYWSNITRGFLLEKMIYMCPMKRSERKTYINLMLFLKIGIPLMLGVVIEAIKLHYYESEIWIYVAKLLCYVSVGIGVFIHPNGIDKTEDRVVPITKSKEGKFELAAINILTHTLAVIFLFQYETFRISTLDTHFSEYLLGIGVVVLLVLDGIILATQYKEIMEQAIDYETAYQIQGKKRYIVSD